MLKAENTITEPSNAFQAHHSSAIKDITHLHDSDIQNKQDDNIILVNPSY